MVKASGTPRTASVQCNSRDGEHQRGSSCGGKGSPTRTCASGIGGVWHLACVQFRELRLQGILQTVQSAQLGRQVGAPPGPSCGHMRPWSQHQAALHRELSRARPQSGARMVELRSTIPRVTGRCCRPPSGEEICKATLPSLSCSGWKPCSTRRAPPRCMGIGQHPLTWTTSSLRARRACATRCRPQAPPRWRRFGSWTIALSAGSSWVTEGETGLMPTPPALLHLAHGARAALTARGGTHARVGKLHHRLQWDPRGRECHPRDVEPSGQVAGIPDGLLRQGGDAPLRGPMA